MDDNKGAGLKARLSTARLGVSSHHNGTAGPGEVTTCTGDGRGSSYTSFLRNTLIHAFFKAQPLEAGAGQ